MKNLITSPLRVYTIILLLGLVGIWSGMSLPISLFPNSSRPNIRVSIPYGGMSAEDFKREFGDTIESQLSKSKNTELEIDRVETYYYSSSMSMRIFYEWGADPDAAMRETESTVSSFRPSLPEDSKDNVGVWTHNENSGFLAISFYSTTRDLDSLYDLLHPLLTPRLAQVHDAQTPYLYNPNRKEIRIELKPQALQTLNISPLEVERSVRNSLRSLQGGYIPFGEEEIPIKQEAYVKSFDDLSQVVVNNSRSKPITLSQVANVSYGLDTSATNSFKTSGAPSLILFAAPKMGGNVKKMAEDIISVVQELSSDLPKDIQYKVLVDPSEFIRSAIRNVSKEVVLGASLAVVVLFLFIGSFKNVITTAVEIPISLIIAFTLMRIFEVNVNLISLAGLALAAGMNVDASIVVMENIFRHFDRHKKRLSFEEKTKIVLAAVDEVKLPVLTSTISSCLVFLPLMFTKGLSYAILGDLAKAVVFSHAFSALVALILVPTVRLQISRHKDMVSTPQSLMEKPLNMLSKVYEGLLRKLLSHRILSWSLVTGLSLSLAGLLYFVLPNLPKEVVGKPDSDWIYLAINTQGNTLLRQMETEAEKTERKILEDFSDKILYTFNQVTGNNHATIMLRLKDKRQMFDLKSQLEEKFSNSATTRIWIDQWNPSELQLPDPPNLRIYIRGGNSEGRAQSAKQLVDTIQEQKIYPRVWSEPDAEKEQFLFLKPMAFNWALISKKEPKQSESAILQELSIVTRGKNVGELSLDGKTTPISLNFPKTTLTSIGDLSAYPLRVGEKVMPLRAVTKMEVAEGEPNLYRETGVDLFLVEARLDSKSELSVKEAFTRTVEALKGWTPKLTENAVVPSFSITQADEELSQALRELGTAFTWSVVIILFLMIMQFGRLRESLIVLLAIPLGFIGVLCSLSLFQSTLSLNAILGMILLNGIAVNNSIILVDFGKRLHLQEGLNAVEAVITAAKSRLRPILITSLTTILGMTPIALGFGEGGRIIQPLGIAVAGGLWVSTCLTLVLVPVLHGSYLRSTEKRGL